MQNTSKRQWSQNITLKDVIDICIDTSIKFRTKNVLSSEDANIYYCYVVDNFSSIDYMQNFSSLLKFGQKDTPLTDRTRDRVLRMLSVAVKAHYFLFDNEKSLHEPYFYCIPDISYQNKLIYGLIYKLSNGKTLIVSQRDLKNISAYKYVEDKQTNNKYKNLKKENIFNFEFEFPTVVSSNNFKWFYYTKWSRLKHLKNETFNLKNNNEQINKDNEINLKLKKIEDKNELIIYSDILDVPYELKDQMSDCGCIWNANLKCWVLPKGHDTDNVKEYLNVLKIKFNIK